MFRSSFLEIFDKNLNKNPNKIISSDFEQSLNWNQFAFQANYYAKKFERLNQKIIPIIVDRTVKTPCSIVGCVLAKKIFVPISSEQPINRIERILNQLEVDFILNLENLMLGNKYISIKETNLAINNNNFSKKRSIEDSEPLYILFTSGSTGDPKGVKVSERNLLNTMVWSHTYQKWEDNDLIGITTNFGFDISLFDLFSSLYSNIPHYIIRDPKDPFNSGREIIKNKITSIFSSPSFFSSLIKSEVINTLNKSNMRQIFSGGDIFPPDHINKFKQKLPNLDIYNVWGPTETSIVNTMHKISEKDLFYASQDKKDIPIGKLNHPLMPCMIVDENREKKIKKPFQRGEIVVSGTPVSLGYFNNKGNQDFLRIQEVNYFYTNDIGYFDENHNLYIVGRKGFTIKINGYRVNLKEIESQVISFPEIHQAIAFNPKKYKEFIFIAVELENKQIKDLKFGELRSFLRKKIPIYMLPKKLIILNELPKNINGKIDRKATEIRALEEFENS